MALRRIFCSSRRRHTRYWRDWSSDVCSSDLTEQWQNLPTPTGNTFAWDAKSAYVRKPPYFEGMRAEPAPVQDIAGARTLARSEERRVGKECRSRWSPYH